MTEKKTKKKKPIRIMTLDTETRGLEGAIFRAGLYDGKQYWASDHIEDLLQIIRNLSERFKCHVYIHNADFDLSKFFHLLTEEIDFSKSVFINNVAVKVPFTDSITFHCSYRLLPSSLEKLSKDFGLEQDGKMSLDDYMIEQGYRDKTDFFMRVPANDPVLNMYMEKDCTSLYKILKQVIKMSDLYLYDFVLCSTVASLAMKVFQKGYPDDYAQATSSNFHGIAGNKAEETIRVAYYGGRTEVIQPLLENGFHYDVNSLYPYVMKVNTYPFGWYETYAHGEASFKWKQWMKDKQGGGFMRCVVRIPHDMHIPPLPYHDGGKLIFPVGVIEGTWVLEEIEMAVKYGCVVEEIYTLIYFNRRDAIFEGYVTEMEQIKTTSKGAKREFSKLMQNSLYGKFGMKRERDTFANMEDLDKIQQSEKPYHFITNVRYNLDLIETVTMSKAAYIQPHLAAYVTAYARILLYESMMKTIKEGNKLAYCDTDSMVIDGKLPDELVDENAYGKWKLEYEVTEGIFFQPKFYYEAAKTHDGKTFDVLKAKGIPRSRVKDIMSPEKFQELVAATIAGRQRFKLYDNTIENPIQMKPKLGSAIKNNDIDPNVMVIVSKSLNLQAQQKRNMDFVNNTSTPLTRHDAYQEVDDEMLDWMQTQDRIIEAEQFMTGMTLMFGKIQTPKKTDRHYDVYTNLSVSTKRQYFRKDGVPFHIWMEQMNQEYDATQYGIDNVFKWLRDLELKDY